MRVNLLGRTTGGQAQFGIRICVDQINDLLGNILAGLFIAVCNNEIHDSSPFPFVFLPQSTLFNINYIFRQNRETTVHETGKFFRINCS